MATKLLVCPECASEVAPGRFACTSCGALLASVASAPRSLGWTEAMTPPAVNPASHASDEPILDAVAPEKSESNGHGETIGPAWAHGPLERAPGETDLDLTADEAISVTATNPADAQPGVETAAPLEVEPVAQVEPDQNIQFNGDVEVARDDAPLALAAAPAAIGSPAEEPAPLVKPGPVVAVAAATLPEPKGEPSWPESRGWPPPGAPQPAPEPAPRPRAGAYLPPSAVLTTVGDAAAAASGSDSSSPAPLPATNSSVANTVHDGAAAAPWSRRMPDIDRAFPPQAVLVGTALATLGFLLPWAPIVIGSAHIGSYLDQWGLAAPGNAALLLVFLALGAAASQTDRLPGWARPGLPAVILAGILLGLVWPYLFTGALQPSIGVYLTLAAAIVLVVGGLLDLWVSRHAGGSRPV
ncbi:MAG TPA: hypothetical protein VK697_14595 [Methylomirabilota bacterium]|nr:hypothetical protein [Methylomirabilota bacterium]